MPTNAFNTFFVLHQQVNPSDLSNDADPKFLAEFYKNLKILSQDLYKKSVVASTNSSAAAFSSPAGKADAGRNNPKLAKFKTQASMKNLDIPSNVSGGDEASAVVGNPAFAHPADYFTAESLHERMKTYAQQGGIPLDYLDRYAAGRGRGNTVASEQEE